GVHRFIAADIDFGIEVIGVALQLALELGVGLARFRRLWRRLLVFPVIHGDSSVLYYCNHVTSMVDCRSADAWFRPAGAALLPTGKRRFSHGDFWVMTVPMLMIPYQVTR